MLRFNKQYYAVEILYKFRVVVMTQDDDWQKIVTAVLMWFFDHNDNAAVGFARATHDLVQFYLSLGG